MIFGQKIDHLVQRYYAGRGQDSRLPHPTAELLSCTPGALDEFLGSTKHRSYRRT